jgi:hypothetical protein
VAKHKTVTHLPSAPASASAPRLAAQLLTVAGELVIVAACVLGLVTAGRWLIAGADLRGRAARQPPLQQREIVLWCHVDRRGYEWCEREPVYRPPVRRFYARDGV